MFMLLLWQWVGADICPVLTQRLQPVYERGRGSERESYFYTNVKKHNSATAYCPGLSLPLHVNEMHGTHQHSNCQNQLSFKIQMYEFNLIADNVPAQQEMQTSSVFKV